MAAVATPVSAEQNSKIAELSKQLNSEGEHTSAHSSAATVSSCSCISLFRASKPAQLSVGSS